MNVEEFISLEIKQLVIVLKDYKGLKKDHQQVQSHLDHIFSKWDHIEAKEQEYTILEEAFWYSVFTIQHLASEDHWKDGITQKELDLIISVLIGRRKLPEECTGRRS